MNDSSFESLGLNESILKALREEGYDRPTPIQAAAIPSLLLGRDLLGCAQTGTGKTAAFALPIIQRLSGDARKPAPRGVRVLVVAPTRELAAQIDVSFKAYSRGSHLTQACVFGGVGKAPQERALARGVDVLVATPGRLLDLHGEGKLHLNAVETVVLDEADRMLDMGFIRDVRKIVALLPTKRQTLLFSATMPSSIAELAAGILKNPLRVDISPETPTALLIEQGVAYVEKNDKRAFLTSYIEESNVYRALIFTRTKHGADRLAKSLEKAGIASAAIHANKSQNNRTRTMDSFRSGDLRVLVATDLAARGIDVDGITHVFNYELPNEPETYVHRIGRTARAGASGIALALCDAEEKALLRDIEKLIGRKVPLASGPAVDAAYKAAAVERAAGPSAEEIRERARDRSFERPRGQSGSRGKFRPDTQGRPPQRKTEGAFAAHRAAERPDALKTTHPGPRNGNQRSAAQGMKPRQQHEENRGFARRTPAGPARAPEAARRSGGTDKRYEARRYEPSEKKSREGQDLPRGTRDLIAEACGRGTASPFRRNEAGNGTEGRF